MRTCDICHNSDMESVESVLDPKVTLFVCLCVYLIFSISKSQKLSNFTIRHLKYRFSAFLLINAICILTTKDQIGNFWILVAAHALHESIRFIRISTFRQIYSDIDFPTSDDFLLKQDGPSRQTVVTACGLRERC